MAFPLQLDLHAAPDPAGSYVLAVRLAGTRGERYSAVGVGETVEAALAWARESAPGGSRWLIAGWSDLYGD
jgi:hypothetical protein